MSINASGAKPQENGSANTVTTIGKSGVATIDALLFGVKWSGNSITYSAPNSASDYQADHPEYFTGLTALSSTQLIVAHATLGTDLLGQKPGHVGFSVEGFTNLSTSFISGGSGAGTLRLANSFDPYTAYAYYPSNASYGGDVFFGPSGDNPVAGNYDYLTIIHEIGHALGLKHPHESNGLGVLSSSLDSMEMSVMSYRSYVGASLNDGYTNETWGYAQTFMMLDIAALQQMYGADYTTNAGNTTYSWNPNTGATTVNGAVAIAPGGNRVFLTVWDGGGIDTYDLSAYSSNLVLNLQPGKASTFSATQLADLDIYGGHKASGNVYNALLYKGNTKSLIENAVGGKGADNITGNDAANVLKANLGNDTVDGGAGNDTVYGGAGNDLLSGGQGVDVVVGGAGADTFRFYTLAGSPYGAADTLVAGDSGLAFDGAGSAKIDVINLASLDANLTVGGDQAFKWGGTTTKAKGYLWASDTGTTTNIWGNIDNDALPEFHLKIADAGIKASAYVATDFVL